MVVEGAFASGFRPYLSGYSNSPQSPHVECQQDSLITSAALLPNRLTPFSVSNQKRCASASITAVPPRSISRESSAGKRRRRFPGPVGLLGINADTDEQHLKRRKSEEIVLCGSQDSDAPLGVFVSAPWLALCNTIDIRLPERTSFYSEGIDEFKASFSCTIADVRSGLYDFRAPLIAAVIDSVSKTSDTDFVITLADPTSKIDAFVHKDLVIDSGAELVCGASILLKDPAILISGPGLLRSICIHPDSVIAIFPIRTVMPNETDLNRLRSIRQQNIPKFSSKNPSPGIETIQASNSQKKITAQDKILPHSKKFIKCQKDSALTKKVSTTSQFSINATSFDKDIFLQPPAHIHIPDCTEKVKNPSSSRNNELFPKDQAISTQEFKIQQNNNIDCPIEIRSEVLNSKNNYVESNVVQLDENIELSKVLFSSTKYTQISEFIPVESKSKNEEFDIIHMTDNRNVSRHFTPQQIKSMWLNLDGIDSDLSDVDAVMMHNAPQKKSKKDAAFFYKIEKCELFGSIDNAEIVEIEKILFED